MGFRVIRQEVVFLLSKLFHLQKLLPGAPNIIRTNNALVLVMDDFVLVIDMNGVIHLCVFLKHFVSFYFKDSESFDAEKLCLSLLPDGSYNNLNKF